jgi:tetratricopeptide (TPR) repeat protein
MIAGGALVALVFLADGLALRGAFIWDDLNLITQSPLVHASDGLWRFWFTTQAPDYFPLTSTTWWIEWRVWGDNPAGYHFINLLLHAASAMLLWRILRHLALPGAWLAAAIWAVHPVQVESVAWIAERKNTLSAALAAAAMLLMLRYFKSNQPRIYIAALVLFTAALLAKTAIAPLPVVMFVCALRFQRPLRRAVLEIIPFLGITAALCAVTIYFQSQRSIATDVVRTDGLASRVAIAGRAVWFYLGKLACPFPLAFVYPRWPTGEVSMRAFIPLFLLILSFAVLWIGRRKWGWVPLLSMAYFVLMLLPVLGLINIYFMRYSLVADHWQYAASVGPIAFFASVVARLQRGISWIIGMAMLLLLLGMASERRTDLYHTAESLWLDTIAKNPTSWMPRMNLGHTFAAEGRYAEAEQNYRIASNLAPGEAEPHYSIATVEAEEDQYAPAVQEYQKAVALNPHVAVMYLDLGHSLEQLHRLDDAIAAYRTAVSLQPQWARARLVLAAALFAAGKSDEATEQYRQALRIDPSQTAAYRPH